MKVRERSKSVPPRPSKQKKTENSTMKSCYCYCSRWLTSDEYEDSKVRSTNLEMKKLAIQILNSKKFTKTEKMEKMEMVSFYFHSSNLSSRDNFKFTLHYFISPIC